MCQQSSILLGVFFRISPNIYHGWSYKIFTCNLVCIIQRKCIIHALFTERRLALTLHMWWKKFLKGVFHVFLKYYEAAITPLFVNTIGIFIADACNLTKALAISAYFLSIKGHWTHFKTCCCSTDGIFGRKKRKLSL